MNKTNSLFPDNWTQWLPGDHIPFHSEVEPFLRSIVESGFTTFIGSFSFYGGVTSSRLVDIVSRGRGGFKPGPTRWLIQFEDRLNSTVEYEVVTTSLEKASLAAILWLQERDLEEVVSFFEDSEDDSLS